MEFFMDPEVTFGNKALEVFYIVMGLMSIYAGIRNYRDKTNPARVGTAVFWCSLGVVLARCGARPRPLATFFGIRRLGGCHGAACGIW